MGQISGVCVLGDFTEEEFATLLATLRMLDKRRPAARFSVEAFDDSTRAEAVERLQKALPNITGRETVVVDFSP
jgi:hypothetical protein